MKKKIYFILISLFILILLISLCLYKNSLYSLENIKNILKSQNYTYINVHLIVSNFDLHTNTTHTVNTYIKDNLTYSISHNDQNEKVSEVFLNQKNLKRISILYPEKTIIIDTYDNSYSFNPTSGFFDTLDNNDYVTYKYHGKEKINNKNYLKLSLTVELSNQAYKYYYYIDEKNNTIAKIEYYNGDSINTLTKYSETTYTYIYDVVTDNDILQFDSSRYTDFNYIQSSE